MSERFSTAGMYLAYCVESTAGSRPTSGYTTIPEVKSIPSFNPSPEGIESTTLSETEYKTYVKGLKDLGQALEFNANMTDDLDTAWGTLISAYNSAIAASTTCMPYVMIKASPLRPLIDAIREPFAIPAASPMHRPIRMHTKSLIPALIERIVNTPVKETMEPTERS